MAKKGEFKKGATADSIRQRAYNGSPEQLKRRAERNASRAKAVKTGVISKNSKSDIDHKNHNTSDMSKGNLRARSVTANRADNLKTGGRKKK